MRNELTMAMAFMWSGIIELLISHYFAIPSVQGMGIASIVYSVVYSTMYKVQVGEWIWTTNKQKNL